MKSLLAFAGAHKVATVAVAAVVVVGGVNAARDDATSAAVAKVVDGDTIDVTYDGGTHRVRLLNVNTPESVDPDKPVECLGPEASDYLRGRLPVRTEIRLEHDVERQDGYGRELAAVYLGDELINASIAREGLGVPMSVGDNTKFLPPVEAAKAEAQRDGAGLHSTTTACPIPAQVAALDSTAASIYQDQPPADAELDAYDAFAEELATVAATTTAVSALLHGTPDAFPLLAHDAVDLAQLRSQVDAVQTRLASAKKANAAGRAAERGRLNEEARRAAEEAARKAAEEEAARKAAEEEAARQAAEEAEAAREAAEATANRPSTPRRTPSPGSGSSSGGGSSGSGSSGGGSSSGSGGSGGYTGCRSYAPGGKSYTPIDCDTKQPIG